jgi:hypothetical protein
LWRAVFQAGQTTDRHNHAERARVFVNEIIRNNAAVCSTELNSWSLSYYLGNARFRLLELQKSLAHNEETAELHKVMSSEGLGGRRIEQTSFTQWFAVLYPIRTSGGHAVQQAVLHASIGRPAPCARRQVPADPASEGSKSGSKPTIVTGVAEP